MFQRSYVAALEPTRQMITGEVVNPTPESRLAASGSQCPYLRDLYVPAIRGLDLNQVWVKEYLIISPCEKDIHFPVLILVSVLLVSVPNYKSEVIVS
jgi:hypothetical protein